jgi:hypothetical protein
MGNAPWLPLTAGLRLATSQQYEGREIAGSCHCYILVHEQRSSRDVTLIFNDHVVQDDATFIICQSTFDFQYSDYAKSVMKHTESTLDILRLHDGAGQICKRKQILPKKTNFAKKKSARNSHLASRSNT